MTTQIQSLLGELDERTVAQRVGLPHDEARMRYRLRSNTVGSFDEFGRVIGEYLNYHFTVCVSNGGRLSPAEASGRAKEILEGQYRRRGGNIVSAFNDAHDGTNGGLRAVLDIIAEALKEEAVERHVRDAFDRYVAPNSWESKVEIMRQLLAYGGGMFAPYVRPDQPERYAHDYQDLIRSYMQALQKAGTVFRRL